MKAGRSKKYKGAETNKLAEKYARQGLTDKDIYKKLGVSSATFYQWRNDYPEFTEALKRGKKIPDIKVENALYKSCLGYKYDEISEETKIVRGQKVVVRKVVHKQAHPNPFSIKFWLVNRCKDRWKGDPSKFVNSPDQDIVVEFKERDEDDGKS